MSTLDAVTSELASEPHLWWGHHPKHGWVVLDRQDERNEGEGRHLTRCRDWNHMEVSRHEFGSPQFVWFKTYLASLPAAKVREVCDQLLALRREYLAWDNLVSLKKDGWLTCKDPGRMLAPPGVIIPLRKKWLFGIACCRRIWHLLEEDCRQAILLAECFIDGKADPVEVCRVRDALDRKRTELRRGETATRESMVRGWSLQAVESVLLTDASSTWKLVELATHAKQYNDPPTPEMLADRAARADLLREILGHPFRPVAFQPHWRTPTALALAQAIYAEQAFEQLPILGDALEDAGCDNQTLLAHLRETRQHVRGCWALDLVLDRS